MDAVKGDRKVRSEADRALEEVLRERAGSEEPIRAYIREIGGFSVFSKEDERRLARRIEAGGHVTQLSSELATPGQAESTAWQVVTSLIERAFDAEPLANALNDYLALGDRTTPSAAMYQSGPLRDVLDGNLPEEMLKHVGGKLNESPRRMREQLVALSLNSRLIPENDAETDNENERAAQRHIERARVFGCVISVRFEPTGAPISGSNTITGLPCHAASIFLLRLPTSMSFPCELHVESYHGAGCVRLDRVAVTLPYGQAIATLPVCPESKSSYASATFSRE